MDRVPRMKGLTSKKQKQYVALLKSAHPRMLFGLASVLSFILYHYNPLQRFTSSPSRFFSAGSSTLWALNEAVQREKQRDYCVRHYTGHALRDDIRKVAFQSPNADGVYDMFVYKEGDIVSQDIINHGSYEPELLLELGAAMEKARQHYSVERQHLHFLDIGGNIGTHTVYMRSLGYPGITFEPMPANEDLVRSNLCANDPDGRVILFTKGLSNETTICDVYSPPRNKGDGTLSCPGGKPGPKKDGFILSGRLEVTTLDTLLGGAPATAFPYTVGALKLDVEGFESKVIEGAMTYLRHARIPFIVMEIWNLSSEELKKLITFFNDLGYETSTWGFFAGFREDLGDLTGVKDLFFVLSDAM